MRWFVETTHKLYSDYFVVLINILYQSRVFILQTIYIDTFCRVLFEVENDKKIDICWYFVFSYTCRENKNELSNEAFEQTWNFTI